MIQNARKANRGEGGFTLIELLVVMIIIAILMAVAVPTFLKQKQSAVRTQATSNVKAVVNSIEACAADNLSGSYVAPTNCTLSATLLAMEPTLANITTSGSTWTVAATGTLGYVVTVRTNTGASFIENHAATGGITKTCTPGSEGAGKACPTTGRW